MLPEEFSREVAHRLVDAEALPESEVESSACPRCHSAVTDTSGRHAVGCGNAFGDRHDSLKRLLVSFLRQLGLPFETECSLERIGELAGKSDEDMRRATADYASKHPDVDATRARPADLLMRWPTLAGVAGLTAFDITVRSPNSDAVRRASGTQAAPACMLGEEDKLKAESALKLVGAVCYPLAMSTNGRMSPRMKAFVEELARRLARRRDETEADEKKYLMHRISVTLHRANGVLLATIREKMRAQCPQ